MGHQHWTGSAVFTSVTERDRYGDEMQDFIDAKQDVVPYEAPGWAPGVERLAQLHLDETTTGPGIHWSCLLPAETDPEVNPLYNEAMQFADAAVIAHAVDGTQGSNFTND
jgi:hypothetical protein